MKNYFLQYANCLPVKGAKRSLICDIQRSKVKFIPNDLFEILTRYKNKNLLEVIEFYGNENKDTISEYYDFLIQNDFGFWAEKSDIENFPELCLEYKSPFEITNVIIDYSQESHKSYRKTFNQLEDLGAIDLQLRFFEVVSLASISNLLSFSLNTRIKSIQLVVKYDESIYIKQVFDVLKYHLRVVHVIIHSAPFNKECTLLNTPFVFTKDIITDESHCGIISTGFFDLNIASFTEALNYNSCLHKKISIDKNGDIKNCPSMAESFGNIKDTTLKEVLEKPGFKKYWNVTKDQVEVCKDCEFRYICTDCRAYTEKTHTNVDGLDISKPLKCGYNPYTTEWEEWSTNPLKKKAIEYYGMQELVKKDA